MSDVSNKVLLGHLLHLESHNLTTEDNLNYLFSGLKIPALSSPLEWKTLPSSGYFDWDAYAEITLRIKHIFPNEIDLVQDFTKFSFSSIEATPWLNYGVQITSYALSIRQVFRMIYRWGGVDLFSIIEPEWHDHGEGLFSISLTIPEPNPVIPEFFKISYETFLRYPSIVGFEGVQIEHEVVGRTAKYLISDPKPQRITSKLRKLYGAMLNAPTFLQFLHEQGESQRQFFRRQWKSQQELEKIHLELEERIEQRTIELENSNKSLLKSEIEKKQLQKLEALGTLAGGVAHDFNNILQGIFSSLNLASQALENSPDAQANIQTALKFGEKGRNLVEQILLFSRKEESERKGFDLVQVIQEALPLLRGSGDEVLTLETKLHVASAPILGNASELTQALLNLWLNSAYACQPEGTFTIELTSVEDSQKSKVFKLIVSDTGPGIPPKIQERIFEPFFSTKPAGAGTGMGLALSQGVITRHQGQLELNRDYENGAQFIITIPEYDGEILTAPSPSSQLIRGYGEHILLVEDEQLILELLQTQLQDIGYLVTPAKNGVEALLKLEANPSRVDLIISDLNMPEMGGDVLAEWLHRAKSKIPVILFTGYRIPESLKRLEGARLAACLTKPIHINDLSREIREVFDIKKN